MEGNVRLGSGQFELVNFYLSLLFFGFNGYMQERHSHSTHTPLIEIIA